MGHPTMDYDETEIAANYDRARALAPETARLVRRFTPHRDRPTQRFRPHARRGAAAPECARNFAASSRDSTISQARHAQSEDGDLLEPIGRPRILVPRE